MNNDDFAMQFAARLEDLLKGVLKSGQTLIDHQESISQQNPFAVECEAKDDHYIISHSAKPGVLIYADGAPLLLLVFNYDCKMNSSNRLTVMSSSIKVFPAPKKGHMFAPFFHYDYVRNKGNKIPAAHININASNDELSKAMLHCGMKQRGRNRRKDFIDKGEFPMISTLHFPVGGTLCRPALEDVLEMLVREFSVDVHDDWHKAIEESRVAYRTTQYEALVREHPEIARRVLEELDARGDDIQNPVGSIDRLSVY